jgi:hypothetical protein
MLLVAAVVSGLATVASSAAAGELLPHGDCSATITPTSTLPANWTVVCANNTTVVCANNTTCPTFGMGTHKGSSVPTATGNVTADQFRHSTRLQTCYGHSGSMNFYSPINIIQLNLVYQYPLEPKRLKSTIKTGAPHLCTFIFKFDANPAAKNLRRSFKHQILPFQRRNRCCQIQLVHHDPCQDLHLSVIATGINRLFDRRPEVISNFLITKITY